MQCEPQFQIVFAAGLPFGHDINRAQTPFAHSVVAALPVFPGKPIRDARSAEWDE
jgi:hypothetical protein